MTKCKYYEDCPANCGVDARLERPMSIIDYIHHTYCHNNPSKCARYQVREVAGKEKVPADLLPYQDERVEKIINNS